MTEQEIRPARTASAARPVAAKSAAKPTATAAKRARRTPVGGAAHDRKREQILEVAENLFFKHGYAGTTITDIADKIGVTKPFVYYYFRNKDDLFETLSWQASQACLTSLHFGPEDTRPAIERLHEGLHRLSTANIQYFKAGTFYYRDRGAMRPAFLRKLRGLARGFHNDMCNLIDQARQDGDVDCEDVKLTALAAGAIIGFMYVWYNPGGPVDAKDMADKLTRILLKTVGARPSPLPPASD